MAKVRHTGADDVTSASRISQLLKELKDNRTLLNVTVPGHKGSYTSTILEVNPHKGEFLLDELNPRLGHEQLLKTGEFHVSTQLKRVQIRFGGALRSAEEVDGIALYRVPLPTSLYYAQNREHFRINIRLNDRPIVKLTTAGGTSVAGTVVDLSVGGAGLLIRKDAHLEAGYHFQDCHIELPSGEKLTCSAFIRHIRPDQHSNKQRVGLQFSGLKPAQERALQGCVTKLQRKLLKA